MQVNGHNAMEAVVLMRAPHFELNLVPFLCEVPYKTLYQTRATSDATGSLLR